MNTWEIAILKSINSLGGEAKLQDVYKRLSKFIQLTEEHKKETRWGGRPMYEHEVRSCVANLYQTGELDRILRGRYRLTDKGKKRISS